MGDRRHGLMHLLVSIIIQVQIPSTDKIVGCSKTCLEPQHWGVSRDMWVMADLRLASLVEIMSF